MKFQVGQLAQPETPHPEHPHRLLTALDVDKVFCDGNEIKFAIAFDDVEGWIEYYLTDPNGKLIPSSERDGEMETKRITGKVTYILARES